MSSKLTIKHSKNTVACRIGNEIYLHPQLYYYPKLCKAILKHEKEHTDGFSIKDFFLDMNNDHLKGHKKEYYKFLFTHPRALLGLLPISKIGKHWAIDPTMLIFMVGVITVGFLWGKLFL